MAKIMTLSLDGNAATWQQVDALSRALADRLDADSTITNIFPQLPADAVKLANNTTVTWQKPLDAEALCRVACRDAGFGGGDWPDYVVSCRPETAALALSVKQASGGRVKIIHIQNPNDATGTYRFDPAAFDLIVRQPHETLDGPNIISNRMALHGITPQVRHQFNAAALGVPAKGLTAVMLGGADENVALTAKDFSRMADDIVSHDAMEDTPTAQTFFLTSRRTGEENKAALEEKFRGAPGIFVDDGRLGYKALLGVADRIIVTGESSSMISEAVKTGQPVGVYMFDGKLKDHPLYRQGVLQDWERDGLIKFYPEFSDGRAGAAFEEMPELAGKILSYFSRQKASAEPRPAPPQNQFL